MPRNKNIKAVAEKVIKQVKEGTRPNISKAMLEVGYSRSTAYKKQKDITSHQDYKNTMKSFENQLDELINDAVEIVQTKKGKATYRDGIEGIDKLKKLKLLVSGNPTDNVKMQIGWE